MLKSAGFNWILKHMNLSLRHIDVQISDFQILSRITAHLFSGEMCALLGPSGAGKSTLFKVILGLMEPDAGTVQIGGHPPKEMGTVGYVPQDDALHRSLSVADEMRYAAQLRLPQMRQSDRDEKVHSILESVGLLERQDVRISRLSGGQRKRVSVALELLAQPKVIILDEPTSGLDPGLEAHMMKLFRTIASQGRIVLVSSHAMESLELCDSILMMVSGHVAFYGRPADALKFFRTDEYADIFRQLPKQSGAGWARTYLSDPISQVFEARKAPSHTQSPPPKMQPTPQIVRSTPAQKQQAQPMAAEPTLDEKLAALKAKMDKEE
jgi:ABC transport system ATP-binding/permease protein